MDRLHALPGLQGAAQGRLMDCSICLDALDSGVVALPCGHRFHVACLAQCAAAVGTAATTSRRGTLTACPNCRTTSRVVPASSAAHRVGEKVLALWGHKWFPGVVDDVIDGGGAYEIAWDDEDSSNKVPASRVRAAPLTVGIDAPAPRHARAAAVVTPRAAPRRRRSASRRRCCQRCRSLGCNFIKQHLLL